MEQIFNMEVICPVELLITANCTSRKSQSASGTYMGVYSLSVLIFYEESLTQMRTKNILKNLPKHVSYVT